METVDPITQLLMMLQWNADYSDDFKRKVIVDAILHAQQEISRTPMAL